MAFSLWFHQRCGMLGNHLERFTAGKINELNGAYSHYIVTPNKDAERCETRTIQTIFTFRFQVFNFSLYLGFPVIRDMGMDQDLPISFG